MFHMTIPLRERTRFKVKKKIVQPEPQVVRFKIKKESNLLWIFSSLLKEMVRFKLCLTT